MANPQVGAETEDEASNVSKLLFSLLPYLLCKEPVCYCVSIYEV